MVRVVVLAANKDGVCLAACLLAENKGFEGYQSRDLTQYKSQMMETGINTFEDDMQPFRCSFS